jgi:hypothetical protein
MRNISVQRPLTHILLITNESAEEIKALTENCKALSTSIANLYYDESAEAIQRIYLVNLAISTENPVLTTLMPEIELDMKRAGVGFSVNPIQEENMMSSGKITLLLNSLWNSAGAILINDQPVTPSAAEMLINLVTKLSYGKARLVLRRKGWFGTDDHVALLASTYVVGSLLTGYQVRLPANYGFGEMVQLMKTNCPKNELLIENI